MPKKSTARHTSQRRRIEQEREVTVRLLSLLNAASDLRELMRDVTRLVRDAFDCDAVGIRLRAGDDFPYYETCGFSPEFVLAENQLCVRDANGQAVREADGYPVLECMCGNVLCGRFHPARPFFTARGSFWTNSTTELLANTRKADRLARTRNRCHGEGFESVALFPLRVGQTTYGLLQVNDKRRDRFTPNGIALLERLAGSLAVAVAHRQSEEQLRESELLYHSLVEQLPQAVFRLDRAGRITFANARYCQQMGRPLQDLLGLTDADLFPADLAAQYWADSRRVMETGEVFEAVERHLRRTGQESYVQVMKWPWRDRDGHIVGLQCMFHDVTDRKRAEAELEQLSRQRQLALRAADMGWWHYDPVTQVATWDERYREIFGVSGSQCPNEEILRLLHPDDLPRVWAAVEAALHPAAPKPFAAEYRVNRPDGTLRWVEAHGLAAFEGEGESRHATSFVGTVADITERKRAEEELKRHRDHLEELVNERTAALEVSEARYRQLFQQAPDAVVLIDAQTGEFVEFNARAHETLGYSRDAFRQFRIPDFDVIESPEEVASHLAKIARQGSDTFDTKHRTETGEIRDVRVTASALNIGSKTHVQAIWTDITEHKQTQAALQAAVQQWQGTFDAVADAVWVLDGDQRIQRCNQASAALFGTSVPAMVGRHCWEIAHATQEPIPECPLLQMRRTECREAMELAMDDRWFQVTVDPLMAENGDLCGAVHIVRDITDQKQAEEEIKAAKELLERRVAERTEAIRMLHDIASLANESQNAEQAVQSCLERMTRYGGWDLGQALLPASDETDALVSAHAWCADLARSFVQAEQLVRLCHRKDPLAHNDRRSIGAFRQRRHPNDVLLLRLHWSALDQPVSERHRP